MSTPPKRVYLKEVAQQIDRRENTIRLWEREGALPSELCAHRDEKGWRYWTPGQVTRLKVWMRREGRAPGSGLRNVKPSVDQTQKMLARLRKPRPERRTRAS
jgi:DNA-binding transcriptional MerR regulator